MTEKKEQDIREPLVISTVTMSFHPMEDRIIMDSSDKNKIVERLWLSKRLLDRLIPTLSDQLEVNSSNQLPIELEQSLAQEKAEMDKQPSEAVKIETKNSSWLVTTIQVGRNENKFQLLFIGEDTNEPSAVKSQAKFDLEISNLRQWLNAVYKIYLKAEWETKAFPEWINDRKFESEKPILLN